MKQQQFKVVLIALVCAIIADIPFSIARVFGGPTGQLRTIGWFVLSVALFAAYTFFQSRRK